MILKKIQSSINNRFLASVIISLLSENPSKYIQQVIEVEGLGPVDNRPSTDELHRFVKKIVKVKKVTCDMGIYGA